MITKVYELVTEAQGTIGALNISLQWSDPNDIDLHVFCPCNTHISFANKKCNQCGGYLDVDKNAMGNVSENPIEHIYFKDGIKPGTYQFYVQYYQKNNGGTDSTNFVISVLDGKNNILQVNEGAVTRQQRDSQKYSFVLSAEKIRSLK